MPQATHQDIHNAVVTHFGSVENTIRHIVDETPRPVYDFIQAAYPKNFELLNPGLERVQLYRNKMYDFLVKKYKIAVQMGQGATWVTEFLVNTKRN